MRVKEYTTIRKKTIELNFTQFGFVLISNYIEKLR